MDCENIVIGKELLYKKIILIQEFFIPKDAERLEELEKCLQFNINNDLIDEIHLSMENELSNEILNHPKIKKNIIGERLTFKKAFDYANQFDESIIKIVANNDISFERESLNKVKRINLTNCCLALTRYDVKSYEPFTFEFIYTPQRLKRINYMSDSQDCWIFTNIKTNEDMNFFFGLKGCDNHIAYLFNKENINIINNSLTIKTFHHHLSNKRYYSNNSPFNKKILLKVINTIELE